MVREKPAKTKIKRRSPGLVITPPVPRPVASDHPARLLFKDAIESAKASSEMDLDENRNASATGAAEPTSVTAPAPKTNPTGEAARIEPLQIFKELKNQSDALMQGEPSPASKVEPDHRREHADAFEAIFGQWRLFLSETQMYILEALYNMTHAVGADRCFTSMPKLASAAGVSERQTYNVIKELEKYGFVERPEIFNTRTKKGTIFRLNLLRQSSPTGPNRRYHYDD